MPSELRESWVTLVGHCKDQDLPIPHLYPAKLGDKFSVQIGDFVAWGTPLEAVRSAITFVAGFAAGVKRCNTPKKTDHPPCMICGEETSWSHVYQTKSHHWLCTPVMRH